MLVAGCWQLPVTPRADATSNQQPATSNQQPATASRSSSVRETHSASRASLQCAMNRPSMRDEVLSRPRIASEEFGRQQVSLQSIARPACEHHVARRMCAAVSEWMHVVERREVELQRRSAVDAAAAAVTHGRPLERSLLMPRWDLLDSTADAWRSWEGDTVEMPTS